MHLLLLNLRIFLNLLTIKHIFISIRSLNETSIAIFAILLMLNTIASHRETFILLIFHLIYLLTILHSIYRLLAAQMLLISRLATHSIGTFSLRSVHKSELARGVVVNLGVPSATCGFALQNEAHGLIVF